MPAPLVFMMGRSPAILPTDREYAKNHMWALAGESTCRFGFSAYAVRLLGDVHHLEWSIRPGTTVEEGRRIGLVEGSKATSDLYAPVTGRMDEFNQAVLDSPTLINTNLYDSGWLFAVAVSEKTMLSPEQYFQHVEATWPLAQRMLKGQSGGSG